MARFYSNENFPKQIVEELRRQHGHDVLTAFAAGNANRSVPDAEVLAFAVSTGRILLTHNRRHFIQLSREYPDHAGIVACTFDPDFNGQARRIHEVVTAANETARKVMRVNRPANN